MYMVMAVTSFLDKIRTKKDKAFNPPSGPTSKMDTRKVTGI